MSHNDDKQEFYLRFSVQSVFDKENYQDYNAQSMRLFPRLKPQ